MNRLNLIDYPNLDLADAGRLPNIGYGSVEAVRAHSIAGGATALLSADITALQTSFDIDDASRFPTAPFIIQIASERMLVGAKSGNTLGSVTRGYGGTASESHSKGRTVFEAKTEYVYLLSPEPVKAISQVYVDGVRQTEGFSAYTGKSGDEHPSWPGKAMIAFSAEADIRKQRDAGENDLEEIAAAIASASHRELLSGFSSGSGIQFGAKKAHRVWAIFEGSGAAAKQVYEARVKNLSDSDGIIRATVKNAQTGEVIKEERTLVPASATKTVAVDEDGGGEETEFSLIAYSGSFEVYSLKKTATVIKPPDEETYETYAPPVSLSSYEKTPMLKPKGKTMAWASYPAGSTGTMKGQSHYASLYNPDAGKARVRLIAVESGGSAIAFAEQAIGAGATGTVTLTHQGGGWDALTKIIVISGEVRVDALYKEIIYSPEGAVPEKPLTTASARVVIGEEITADAEWTEDTSGDYGGVNALIERPDYVIKQFIVERMGFSLSDIDGASFGAAGASYASAISGGYKMACIINDDIKPSAFIKMLAFECRSALRFIDGKWRLDYMPDSAPAPVKTISYRELAGTHSVFKFDKSPLSELSNDITALYKRDYPEGGWHGVSRAEDSASKARYGTYKRELEFHAIRQRETAEHVLSHILLRSKSPRLTVEFPVFYEHFDLKAGDTIEIDNPLYGGKRFCVEEILRTDKFRAEVRGREW